MRRVFSAISILVMLVLMFGCGSGSGQNVQADATVTPRSILTITPKSDMQVLPKTNRPNILVIMIDDLDVELGTMNYMPHLQELLVSQGLTVDDFYVSMPLCCPSRAAFLRGQFAHNNGVYRNEQPYGGFEEFYKQQDESSTLATWLQAAGYHTALLGKYFNGYPFREDQTYIPVGWDEWYSSIKGSPVAGYKYTLNENGKPVNYEETGKGESQYMTDVLARKTVDIIDHSAQDDAPFFIYLATYAPHAPVQPAPRHLSLLPGLKAPRSPSFNEADVTDKPDEIRSDPPLTEDEIKKIDKKYRDRVLTMLAVDEMIGQVVDALKVTGQLENTYILFTSDNGFHMGQHRRREGKGSFYEEDIHVPLIIRGPGIKAGSSLQGYVTGNVDLAPTIAELAGVVPPDFVDGRSLVKLLGSELPPVDEWRSAFLLEFYGYNNTEENAASSDGGNGEINPLEPAYLGLRASNYLYVEYQDGFVELYDLRNDPYELENIASRANKPLLATLSKMLHDLAKCSGEQCRASDNGFIE